LGQGAVLGDRYHLRGLLGRGGMAEVYLAQDDVLGRSVAVKVFHSGPGSLGAPERQRHEAELLASLNRLLTAMTSREPAPRPSAHEVAAILKRGSSTRLLPSVEASTDAEKSAGQPLAARLAGRIGRVHRRAWLAVACAAAIVALAGSAALLEQSATGTETARVAAPSTATVDAAQVPPPTPTTPSAPAQPAAQPEAPAEHVANDPGAEEGREEANNQRNANDVDNDKVNRPGSCRDSDP
jgi:hypothetical protein